jgi:GGDEF domain-containing protein
VGRKLGASIVASDGQIIYSTDHALIGHSATQPLISPSRALDVRVPLLLGNGNSAGAGSSKSHSGMFELAVASGPIFSSADSEALQSAGLLSLILIVLYCSFLPVLYVATNRIRRRLRGMKDRVREMEHQAFHDTLTGLPNRALFRDRVEQAIRAAKRIGGTVAVMVMDLDRFKEVNDTFGHQSGDQLLKEVAGNLVVPLRESDTVARLGGDEFGILAPSVAGPVGALAIAEWPSETSSARIACRVWRWTSGPAWAWRYIPITAKTSTPCCAAPISRCT